MAEAKNLRNQDVKNNTTTSKDLEYMKAKDKELVKGVFKFYEVPGGSMDFIYRKYKGQKPERYSMIDGKVYTIPLGVAKHLNNDCWYPVHAYAMDENGSRSQKISQKVKRCGFQSLEFMDIEDFDRGGKQIIQIENMAIPN
jgi:hypothetical protein